MDTANSLSQVNGYQKITFGDGATLQTENNVQCKNNGILLPMSSRPAGGNFWFDNERFSKCCVEGAVSNLLCQLNLTTDAAKFEKIAICNGEIRFQILFYQKLDKLML